MTSGINTSRGSKFLLPKGDLIEGVRPETIQALEDYVNSGKHPGDFLVAVLANDLTEAAIKVSVEDKYTLPEVAAYVYHHMPYNMRGGWKKVFDYIEAFKGASNGN